MTQIKISSCSVILIVLFSASIIINGCGKEEKAPEVKDTSENSEKKTEQKETKSQSSPGKEFFYMKSSSNNIACADCHGDGTNSDRPLTKYFSDIKGADKRTSTYHGKIKGEEVKNTAGGATICWESYMKMKTPLTPEQIKMLNEYYTSVGTSDSPTEINYETIALPTRDKTKLKEVQKEVLKLKGDPVKGETTFKEACAVCHGETATVKKVPSILEEFEGNTKSVTYNVRLGDGSMPFFNMNVLSDQDIADVSEYVLKINGQ
ncbi:MAG TPA: c-type cytochrome [Ignavibacteria bacterium]|nr:c-type cytochrome [Ignavibacteria bacterium]